MIRLLVVDAVERTRRRVLASVARHDDVLVVGVATGLSDAVESCVALVPDVVALTVHRDIEGDVALVRSIMRERPTPIVIVSSDASDGLKERTFDALKAGALDVVELPSGRDAAGDRRFAERLVAALVLMADVKVVRQIAERTGDVTAPDAGAAPAAIGAVGICSSTGGPAALDYLLRRLPQDFPVPILVVQHIAEGFLEGLVEWLDETSRLQVRIACAGDDPRPGAVYFAPEQAHLRISPDGRLACGFEPPIRSHRPAGEVLFSSMVELYGRRSLGLVLTGMGDDGVDGLTRMSVAGGIVLAQDEATSVVYGMPRAVVDRGAATEVLPLERIAERLVYWVVNGPDGAARS